MTPDEPETPETRDQLATDTDPEDRSADVTESIRSAIDGLRASASVDRAYGDPIETDGKTVVPVARVVYGFGAGGGSGPSKGGEGSGQGSGGGGGMVTQPMGALEITDDETRFVRFTDWKRLALVLGAGVLLGLLLGRRR